MKIVKFLLSILILCIGLGGAYYLKSTRPAKQPLATVEKTWPVTVETLVKADISPNLPLYGRVEAPQTAKLSAAVEADVLQVHIQEGEWVIAGQLLIELDDQDYQLQSIQRQADLDDAKAQYQRQLSQHQHNQASLPTEQTLLKLNRNALARAEKLQKQKLGSQSAVDQAKLAVEQQQLQIQNRRLKIQQHPLLLKQHQARIKRSEAALKSARRQQQRCQIKAPIDGLVAQLNIAQGVRVRTGSSLMTLYDPKKVVLRSQIPQRYHSLIAAYLQNHADKPLQAGDWQLDRLAGQAQAQSGGIEVLFKLSPTAQPVRVGQFIAIQLDLPPLKQVYALPETALYHGDKVYLYDQEQQTLQQRQVTVQGKQHGSQQTRVLLASTELSSGQRVITTQLPNAVSGLKVIIIDQ